MEPEVVIGTDYVHDDEKCMELVETNRVMPVKPKGTRWRRLQIIRLYRNGHLHEHIRDLGPAEDFKASQFRIIGGVIEGKTVYQEETAGFLREQADDMRWNKQWFDVKEHFKLN